MNKVEKAVKIEWKQIKGYEVYEISNTGIVSRNNHEVRPYLTRDGYLIVVLCVNNIRHQFSVHRLVAMNFIKNPNNYECVNHKDENKLNNKVENLEWCTRDYNNSYGSINKRRSETNKKIKIDHSQEFRKTYIRCIETGEVHFLNEWERMGVHNTRLVCTGKIKHSHGLHYEYVKGKGKL